MKRTSRTIPFGVREDPGNEHPERDELGLWSLGESRSSHLQTGNDERRWSGDRR